MRPFNTLANTGPRQRFAWALAGLLLASGGVQAQLQASPPAAPIEPTAPAAQHCPPSPSERLSPELLAAARQSPQERGYLWQLHKKGRSAWLYGTLHLGRAEWVVPGAQLARALRQSDTLALEIDPLDDAANAPLRAPGDPVRRAQVLTPQRLQRLQAQMRAACMDAPSLEALPTLLQLAVLTGQSARHDGLYVDFAIDAVLAGYARHAGLRRVALESVHSQLALFTAESAEEEGRQIDAGLTELESGQSRQHLLDLVNMWVRGDVQRLASYPQWCDCMNTPAEQAQMKKMLDQRNPHLARGIAALHAQGRRVFAAVGALHMVGPQGLLVLLRQRGFTVTQVLPPPY